jgi:hypothetical protein
MKALWLVFGLLLVTANPLWAEIPADGFSSGQNPPQKLWGSDRRIGTIDSIYNLDFDVCRQNGNLFLSALFRFGNTTNTILFLSTDGGNYWTAPRVLSGGVYHINAISGSVLGNYYFIAHTYWANNTAIYIYRANVENGQLVPFGNDTLYIHLNPVAPGDSIRELVLVSDQDFLHRYLNLFIITRSCSLKYYYSDTSGRHWYQVPTGVANARRGLDACTNEGYSNCYAFVTYLSVRDSLQVDGFDYYGNRTGLLRSWVGPNARFTAVGAYHDTAIAITERSGSVASYYCLYFTSYDGGASWRSGVPGNEDTTYNIGCPDVAARYGGGQGVVYLRARWPRYTWRNYYGSWSTPEEFTENRGWIAARPKIEYLGGNAYGCAYISDDPVYGAVYFDRTDWTGVSEPGPLTAGAALTIHPNPARQLVTFTIDNPKPGPVRIKVFDTSGRVVSAGFSAPLPAGTQRLNLDAGMLPPGVYPVRVEAAGRTFTAPLIVSR